MSNYAHFSKNVEKEKYRLEWYQWSMAENTAGLEMALAEEQDINEIVTYDFTAATIAAKNDLVRLYEFLRDHGADFTIMDGHGKTPLMWAALEGSTSVAQKMLSKATALDLIQQKDADNMQALHFAASKGHTDLVEILIAKGADVNALDINGRTPLHYSMLGKTPSTVHALMKAGAQSLGDKEGRTPEKMPGGSAPCRAALSDGGGGGSSNYMSMFSSGSP